MTVLDLLEKVSHGVLRGSGARSNRLWTSQGAVHAYEVPGPGTGTVVMVHGIGSSATTFAVVARRLRREVGRIVLLDLPGHGRSSTPAGGLDVDKLGSAVRESLDQLLPAGGGAVLFGNSLGGAVSLGYALDRPERVGALVLASPGGAPLTSEDAEQLRRRFALRTREDARRFFADLLHAPPWYFRALERGLVDQLGRPVVQGFLRTLRDEDYFSEERLALLAPPTTVLWGKSDRVLPRSGLDFYRRALPPTTRIEELEGVGHSVHLERPGLVARTILGARPTPQMP